MILKFFLTLALLMGIACTPQKTRLAELPVFPGAQGFGTETPAGRGGKILKVRNLRDRGEGSLRAAIEASGPRIIVFEVSGNIALVKNLVIQHPYITIAGQTAPSPGITLKGAGIEIRTHDVLVQHLRVRIGDELEGPRPLKRDGCVVYGPNGSNVVLDHLSISWSVDKGISTWRDGVKNVTISNTICSEALKKSINPQGDHSMGMLVGDHAKNISIIGNLFAHNKGRNPAMKGDTSSVVLNNVMYNGGMWYMYLADDFKRGPSFASICGNVFIKGPSTPEDAKAVTIQSNVKFGTKVHLSGNLFPGILFNKKNKIDPRVPSPPVWHPSLTVQDSSTVEARVLAHSGARPADRDTVDQRIIEEVRSRTGSIIDSQKQVGGWPPLQENVLPFIIPSNPNGDDDGDGYTNIEEVLHRMAAQVEGRQ